MKEIILLFAVLITMPCSTSIAPVRSDEWITLSGVELLDVYWGTDRPVEVSPGEAATLTVILRYESTYTFTSIRIYISLPVDFKAIGEKTSLDLAPVPSGSTIKLSYPIYITPEVKKGFYTADIRLEYIHPDTPAKDELTVTFEVTGRPKMKAAAMNNLREGEQQILILLTNEGDATARYFKIEKAYSSSASVQSVDSELLVNLEPGDNVTVPLNVFVPTGMRGKILPLTVEASYLGPKNLVYLYSETLQLAVKSSNPNVPLTLRLGSKELSVGKTSKIYVEVGNNGTSTISEIKLVLSPDGTLKILGPAIFYIDRLESGRSKYIETEVYVPSTTVQSGSLIVTAAYLDEDSWLNQNENFQLSISLRGLIVISVTDFAVIPSTPSKGSPFSVTLTITNTGTTTAYSTSAMPILEGLPVKPFGPKSVYIGNLETNLPTTFTLNMRLENTTETEIALPVTITYMDNLRSIYNFTLTIPIEVGAPSGSLPQPGRSFNILDIPTIIMALAAVLVLVTVVIVVKRRGRTG